MLCVDVTLRLSYLAEENKRRMTINRVLRKMLRTKRGCNRRLEKIA
jgi:hypothetical protein